MKRLAGFIRFLLPSKDTRIATLRRLHYTLMKEPTFWYDKAIRDADAVLCKAASDIAAACRKA